MVWKNGSQAFGAITPPLYLSSTFAFAGFEQSGEHEYTRTTNPTRDMLADTLAKLEGGVGAVVVSSGMAAIDLVLSQSRSDDLIVAPHDCYGGTHHLLTMRRDRGQFNVAFVDQSDDRLLTSTLKRSPSLVLIETPSNPLMRVVDIRAVALQAKAVGAKVAVDNTFLSPALQRPIALGADFVIHSTTNISMAILTLSAEPWLRLTRSMWRPFLLGLISRGVTGAPFDAYLTLRGLRTLFPRIERQQATAAAVAAFLDRHPLVSAVHYPGLASHPGHAIAQAQQLGFGAMLSFELAGGVEAVRRLVETVEVFTLAESLGGVESLVAHPATMTHSGMTAEARRAAGITDSLLRLSIGLESEADLIADLESALTAADTLQRSAGS
jgi:cystathionine gamma-synthase